MTLTELRIMACGNTLILELRMPEFAVWLNGGRTLFKQT